MNTRIAVCLVASVSGTVAVVRKSAGSYTLRSKTERWSVARRIPVSDVIRRATDRERAQRHVIGGAAGEVLTGAGAAPPVQR